MKNLITNWDLIESLLIAHCGNDNWYGSDGCHVHNRHGDFQYTWDCTQPEWLAIENIRGGYGGRRRYTRLPFEPSE